MRGTEMRQMMPGTIPARAQVPQEMETPADRARLTAKGLAAMAERREGAGRWLKIEQCECYSSLMTHL